MKACPRCESVSAWILGDGRYKCQSCSLRYSWKSVWDSVRLPERTKQSLLQAFVDGVPAYRRTADGDACVDSRERFYRLVRACCVRQGTVSYEALHIAACHSSLFPGTRTSMRGWATTRRVMIIGISEHAGVVQISAPRGSVAHVLPLLRAHSAVSGLVRLQDSQAFANLQVQGEYVIVPRVARAALAMHPVEVFWEYARMRLQAFRKIPVKFFPLYLGEVCFRFNQRDQDLVRRLRELTQSTPISGVRALLAGAESQWVRTELTVARNQSDHTDGPLAITDACEPRGPNTSGVRLLFS